MDLRQMQYFLAVAEQLNFSKAAEVLYVTQPLLSQVVADLERELGCPLFIRSRRSVQLTPAGLVLTDKARSILAEVNALAPLVQKTAAGGGIECTLNIGYEEIFERTYLTQALFHFHRQFPNYHGRLKSYTLGQIVKAMHEGEVDLGFTMLPNRKLSSELEVKEIAEDCLAIAAAKELLAGFDREDFLSLFEHLPLFVMDNDQRGLSSILQICLELNLSPQIQAFQDIHSILMNVEAGSGITILPGRVVKTYASPYLATCSLTDLENAQLTLAACWNRAATNPAIPIFLDCMREISQSKKATN